MTPTVAHSLSALLYQLCWGESQESGHRDAERFNEDCSSAAVQEDLFHRRFEIEKLSRQLVFTAVACSRAPVVVENCP